MIDRNLQEIFSEQSSADLIYKIHFNTGKKLSGFIAFWGRAF